MVAGFADVFAVAELFFTSHRWSGFFFWFEFSDVHLAQLAKYLFEH